MILIPTNPLNKEKYQTLFDLFENYDPPTYKEGERGEWIRLIILTYRWNSRDDKESLRIGKRA